MPGIVIDGRRIEAKEGRTVLEASREAGFYVPSLCFHPKVGQSGLCRICVVEIEGSRGLVIACDTPVREGMVVRTATGPVIEARRLIVELLLADGTHDCLACEMCGACELQDAAYHLGITRPSYPLSQEPRPLDSSHPMIVRDPNRCIHCFRCIRACNEVVVNEVLDMAYRGHRSVVVADQNAALGASSCVGCGECVQLCPTGALTERKAVGRGRAWNLRKVRTTCPYCGVGCQVHLHVDDSAGRVVKVTGVEGAPPNDGMLCIKGRFAYDFPSSQKRLTRPLVKKDGKHVPISWDEALDFAANRLGEIRAKHGPDSIAGIASSRDTNENDYAMMKFMRAVLGTNNIDNCART